MRRIGENVGVIDFCDWTIDAGLSGEAAHLTSIKDLELQSIAFALLSQLISRSQAR